MKAFVKCTSFKGHLWSSYFSFWQGLTAKHGFVAVRQDGKLFPCSVLSAAPVWSRFLLFWGRSLRDVYLSSNTWVLPLVAAGLSTLFSVLPASNPCSRLMPAPATFCCNAVWNINVLSLFCWHSSYHYRSCLFSFHSLYNKQFRILSAFSMIPKHLLSFFPSLTSSFSKQTICLRFFYIVPCHAVFHNSNELLSL